MFDRINVGGGHHSHTHHEHRAPTDESVKLLRELEKEAEKRVLARGMLEVNHLQDVQWIIVRDPFTERTKAQVRFKLNGQEITEEVPVTCIEEGRWKPREFFMAIHQKVIEKLAERLSIKLVDEDPLQILPLKK